MTTDPRLIEDYIPIEAISAEARREKSIRRGHISTLHLWWARRPLVAARAAVYGALAPAPKTKQEAKTAADFVTDLCKYPGAPGTIEAARQQLWAAHAVRLTAETGRQVTVEDIAAGRAPRPRVLDMFAGGGAIPLEALRLGCEAYALDLNPVAHIIQLCTLVYPQQYGAPDPAAHGCARDGSWAGLAAEVAHWGKWVLQQAQAEIGDLYPPIPDPDAPPAGDAGQLGMDFLAAGHGKAAPGNLLTPVAYLWTRTVRCKNPACGGTVPLARQTWLAQKPGRYVALRIDAQTHSSGLQDKKRVRYHRVESSTESGLGFDPAIGSKAGNVACPFCGTVIDSGYVKLQGQVEEIAVQPMAVVCHRPGARGKVYLAENEVPHVVWPNDGEIEERIRVLTAAHSSDPAGPLTVPDEQIVSDSKGSAWVIQYGLRQFGQLFTARQLIALLTFTRKIRQVYAISLRSGYEPDRSRAIATSLAMVLDKQADFLSSLTVFKANGGRGTVHTFGRQALPMVWDFSESNPFNEQSASWPGCLKEVVDNIRSTSVSEPATVHRGSATKLPWKDNELDAIITDPPYYDNVAYADLSDYFYVWLKRSIGHLYPEHFSGSLTPKKVKLLPMQLAMQAIEP